MPKGNPRGIADSRPGSKPVKGKNIQGGQAGGSTGLKGDKGLNPRSIGDWRGQYDSRPGKM